MQQFRAVFAKLITGGTKQQPRYDAHGIPI